MSYSQFFRGRFVRRFPVPMLFFEAVGASIQAYVVAGNNEVLLETVLHECLIKCEVCLDPQPEDLVYAAERLQEVSRQDGDEEPSKPAPTKKGYATAYLKWLSELTPEKACYYLADYDHDYAEHLFCRVDRDVVMDMILAKGEADWQKRVVEFEACLFGFGGSYGDGGDAEEVDIGGMDKDQLAAEMKGFGF